MTVKKVMFSPVTRLEGLLSVEVLLDGKRVTEANASATLFRGYEWIMQDRRASDAVYMTQRICGICSTAHGAVASYLLDELYGNSISENAQYLRNIMYGADFLQNHIRHFYLFSLPDFVVMPDRPPFQGQNLQDARFDPAQNQRLVEHYFESIRVSQECHQMVALFGGKVPHQHSFVHGGVSVAPTADKINQALALWRSIREFVKGRMAPDSELIAQTYRDYYEIGVTPRRFLSFGLFKFGPHNERILWRSGVLDEGRLSEPRVELISEDVTRSWFVPREGEEAVGGVVPDPYKPGAYTFTKSVYYGGEHYQVGPLARMLITGRYRGGTSTMDRIYARTLEASLIVDLVGEWLAALTPGPPPIEQKEILVKTEAVSTSDAMRGALLHRARIAGEEVVEYDIITPSAWNFSPKGEAGGRGPVESSLVGTEIPKPEMLYTVLGRTIRSFDPCLNCATHVLEARAQSGQGGST